jgi:hypothetical protein
MRHAPDLIDAHADDERLPRAETRNSSGNARLCAAFAVPSALSRSSFEDRTGALMSTG